MITEQAIAAQDKVLLEFRAKYKHSTKTVREAIETMPRKELEELVAKLLQAAHNVVTSRL